METSAPKKRILILGGGFAGAYTALHLEKRLASEPGYCGAAAFLTAKELRTGRLSRC